MSISGHQENIYKICGNGVICIPCAAQKHIKKGILPQDWILEEKEATISWVRAVHDIERHQGPRSHHQQCLITSKQFVDSPFLQKTPTDQEQHFRQQTALRFQQVHWVTHKSLPASTLADMQELENEIYPQNELADFGYLSHLGADGATGKNTAEATQSVIQSMNLDPSRCVGLGTDGASNMVGEFKGAGTILSSFFTNAVPIH
ncbi:hypothetical protein BLNAU_24422 [Blattamonas nauphoetae]|uniref:Uncharacterized protein n=1 Tax=Blattamonas nauphoetae TaxID=2049346 RepID=A0ABQ9WMW4_9EUKA|nr:hypothetical protein BLNAU_24422 [Blattamonas nauphoetae]